MPENYFDVWVAQRYEVLWPHLFDPEVVEPAVSFLADLAGDGRALELGIGTGRLALPLSRRGIRVNGIELSSAMVEQLRSQPGSADIDVTIGDFSTTKATGTFTLAYVVRNTIMNLTTQDAEVECFLNVARHLEPGGFFVIEVIVPPWQRLPPGETVIPFDVSPAHLGFDEIDVATQTLGRTTTGSSMARPRPSPRHSATCGHQSWISWLALPGWLCTIGGATGTASPSPARAPATSRSGRSPSSSADADPPVETGVPARQNCRSACRDRASGRLREWLAEGPVSRFVQEVPSRLGRGVGFAMSSAPGAFGDVGPSCAQGGECS